MTRFERFLKDNKIRKIDLASYLGVSPSFVTKMCKGEAIPPRIFDKISERMDWDISCLIADRNESEDSEVILASEVRRLTEAIHKLIAVLEDGKRE